MESTDRRPVAHCDARHRRARISSAVSASAQGRCCRVASPENAGATARSGLGTPRHTPQARIGRNRVSMGHAAGAGMNWEQRLREMLLAGGALAAGCSSHAAAARSTGDASADGAEPGDGAVGGCCGPSSSACCNTGVDPCAGAPAASSAQCVSVQVACESDGGTFTVSFGPGNAVNAACELPVVPCSGSRGRRSSCRRCGTRCGTHRSARAPGERLARARPCTMLAPSARGWRRYPSLRRGSRRSCSSKLPSARRSPCTSFALPGGPRESR